MRKLAFNFLKKIKPELIDEYIRQRWSKPVEFADLQLAFIDDKSLAWYEYPSGMGNSVRRLSDSLQAAEYLTARMSPVLLDNAFADVNKALAHGKVTEAGAILMRLKTIKDEVIPVDVIINMIANDLVREDESLTEKNDIIHQEKCDHLKKVIDNGDHFFFHLTVVKDLSKQFKISNKDWKVLLNGFQDAVNEAQAGRDILLSKNFSNT